MSVTCGNGMTKVGFGRSKSDDSEDMTGVRWLRVGRDRHSLQRPRTKMGKKRREVEEKNTEKGEEKGGEEKREGGLVGAGVLRERTREQSLWGLN